MKFGIELEFFTQKTGENISPAYLHTNNLDGNPFVGELKTDVHNNITDCVFDLKKLIFLEKERLIKDSINLELKTENQFSLESLIEARKNSAFISKKDLEVLEEFSIYPKGKTGKLLKRGLMKASLQVNFSEHSSITVEHFEKVTVENKSKYEKTYKTQDYSKLFNYSSIIYKLDKAFEKEIKDAKRVPGVFAIKKGQFGDRIEYRSLPCNIDLDKLISTLK